MGSPFINWDPEKVRNLAEIEDVMVKKYMVKRKTKHTNYSRIVKGTLNDPLFSSAEKLRKFLERNFKYNCKFCDYGSEWKPNYHRHLE